MIWVIVARLGPQSRTRTPTSTVASLRAEEKNVRMEAVNCYTPYMRNQASMLPLPLAALAVVALATTILLPAFGCRSVADYGYADPPKDSAASQDTVLPQDGGGTPGDKTARPKEAGAVDAPKDKDVEVAADDGSGSDEGAADDGSDSDVGADATQDAALADSGTDPADAGQHDTPAPDASSCPCGDGGPSCRLVLSPTANGTLTKKTAGGLFPKITYPFDNQKLHIENPIMGGESRAVLLFDLPPNAQVSRATLQLCTRDFSTSFGTPNAMASLYHITSTINPIPNDKDTVAEEAFHPTLGNSMGTLKPSKKDDPLDVSIPSTLTFSGLIEFMIIRNTGSQTYYSTQGATNAGNACGGNAAPSLNIEYCTNP